MSHESTDVSLYTHPFPVPFHARKLDSNYVSLTASSGSIQPKMAKNITSK